MSENGSKDRHIWDPHCELKEDKDMLLTDMLKRVRGPGDTRVTGAERKCNFKKKTWVASDKNVWCI